MTADNAARLAPFCYSGTTIWEPARTAAYMAAGIRPARVDVEVRYHPDQSIWYGPAVPTFTDPAGNGGGDPAPWWDPHPQVAPLAAKCAGVVPISVHGLDDDHNTVTVVQTVEGRGVASNTTVTPRTIDLRLALVAQDCCSAAYLLQWFKRALTSGSECDTACYGADLTYLASVPDPADCRSAVHAVAGSGSGTVLTPTTGMFTLRDPASGGSTLRGGDSLRAPAPITAAAVTLRDPSGTAAVRDGEVLRSPQPGGVIVAPGPGAGGQADADAHVRTLTGVHSTIGVVVEKAVGPSCGQCGCGPVIIVTCQLVAGNPEPWWPEMPVASGVGFDPNSPICVADFIRKTPVTVTQQVTTPRVARPIHVLRNGSWCKIGTWDISELQQFGGTAYAVPTFPSENAVSTPATPPALTCFDVTVVNAPIVLRSNFTWVTDGTWTHDQTAAFPSPLRNYSISGQLATDYLATVTSTVMSGNCASDVCDAAGDPLTDPNCVVLSAPTAPPPPAGCGVCRSMLSLQQVFEFTQTKIWSNYAPIFEFYSGNQVARSIDFLLWSNPNHLNPHDPVNAAFFRDCNVCAGWTLSYVPANTRVRVDGRTRRVTAVLSDGTVVPASRNLAPLIPGMGITWPDLGCEPIVGAVRVGKAHIDPGSARADFSVAFRDG